MRAVRIVRVGGPEVLDIVDLPDPEPKGGQQVFDVATAGVNYADTHHRLSGNSCEVTRRAGRLGFPLLH